MRKLNKAILKQRRGLGTKRAALAMQAPIGVGGSAPRPPAGTGRSPNPSTRRWRELRARKLHVDPGCELQLPGCEGAAVEVDHIVRLADGGDRFEWSNLRSTCEACHKQRHGKRKYYGFDPDTGLPLDPGHWWQKS